MKIIVPWYTSTTCHKTNCTFDVTPHQDTTSAPVPRGQERGAHAIPSPVPAPPRPMPPPPPPPPSPKSDALRKRIGLRFYWSISGLTALAYDMGCRWLSESGFNYRASPAPGHHRGQRADNRWPRIEGQGSRT